MKQLALNFPPPWTPAQLIAADRLAHMVEQNRNSFSTIDYAKRRKAMLSHTRKDS